MNIETCHQRLPNIYHNGHILPQNTDLMGNNRHEYHNELWLKVMVTMVTMFMLNMASTVIYNDDRCAKKKKNGRNLTFNNNVVDNLNNVPRTICR
jgi:hypothetical protein